MTIKVCDRCKKHVYPDTDEVVWPVHVDRGDSKSDELANVELCDSCLKEVLHFMFITTDI